MPFTTKYDVLEDESDRQSGDHQSRYTYSKRLSTILLWYSAISTTIILILSIVLLSAIVSKSFTAVDSMPPIRTITEPVTPKNCLHRPYKGIYGRHRQYQSLDHRYDILWDDIENDQRVIPLPDPDEQGQETPSVIAMFHQLHCLQWFRLAIQMGHEGMDPGFSFRNEEMHWPHCLDYMRSTILCWADDTVERWSFFENGTLSEIAEGYFDDRRCGDNRKLIKTMRDAGSVVRTRPFP